MVIIKWKNQDEHDEEQGSSKRYRVVSGENEETSGQSKQRNSQGAGKWMPIGGEQSGIVSRDAERASTGLNQEVDEWESSSKLIEEELNGYKFLAQLAENDQWSVVVSRKLPERSPTQQHAQQADNDQWGVMQQRKPLEVNAIYRRDIASFLPRVKVEQWRITSH